MLCRSFALIVVWMSLLALCLAADGPAKNQVFAITVDPSTPTKQVQVRYVLGSNSGIEDSTSTATGKENKIVIMTQHENQPATSFKAIAYAPGCQFVTFTVDDLSSGNREGNFQCQKLPSTLFQGRVALSGTEGKDLQVEVLYVCNWAAQFFHFGPGAISPFFVARSPIATDGTFSMELPDFAGDPLWSSLSNDAFLSFRLIDAATGHPLNSLQPPASLSQGSLLKVATGYPGEMLLTLEAAGTGK